MTTYTYSLQIPNHAMDTPLVTLIEEFDESAVKKWADVEGDSDCFIIMDKQQYLDFSNRIYEVLGDIDTTDWDANVIQPVRTGESKMSNLDHVKITVPASYMWEPNTARDAIKNAILRRLPKAKFVEGQDFELILTNENHRIFICSVVPELVKEHGFNHHGLEWLLAPERESDLNKDLYPEPVKYSFVVPASRITKWAVDSPIVLSVINRYFKVCLGRCDWHQDQEFICTGDQLLNFQYAMKASLVGHGYSINDGSLSWINNFQLYTEPVPDPIVYDKYQHEVARWHAPSPGINFVRIFIDRKISLKAPMPYMLDTHFGIFHKPDDSFHIVCRETQWSRFSIDILSEGVALKMFKPEMIDAIEYLEEKNAIPKTSIWDVTSNDADKIMKDHHDE